MTDRIFYKKSDGTVAMAAISSDVTVDIFLQEFPEISEYVIKDVDTLTSPENLREFFDSLTLVSGTLNFDITKARNITKNRLRKERQDLFLENDIKIRDASLENNSTKLSEGLAERDRLRNITLLPDSISDLDALRNLHP